MSKVSVPQLEELPLAVAQRIDQTCGDFEAACKAVGVDGRLPAIEEFLGDASAEDRPALIRELILLKVFYRKQRGERPRAEDFQTRFPDLDLAWLASAIATSAKGREETRVVPERPSGSGSAGTDSNLLFGVLALQADAITRSQFVEACTLWASAKDVTLADLLTQRDWLTDTDRADVERLVQRKLKKHGGDVKSSLAEVANKDVEESLAGIPDTDVHFSLSGSSQAEGTIVPTSLTFQLDSRDRYALLRLHAKGGLGQVWLARDADLGRDVALKELRPDQADNPAIWARFVEEAKITGQLEHPGIVPVYELARRAKDQRPFYTMRYVKGRTLSAAAKEHLAEREAGRAGRFKLRELLGAFVSVCNAVAYAHSRGVLHRDLKGSNVVLGKYGEVMVLDWGLAKVRGEGSAAPSPEPVQASLLPVSVQKEDSRDQTMQGQVLGTPGYMPPEQAEGRMDRVDERSDIYGLGAILYEILTGQAPFAGADTQEVIQKVLNENPIQPRVLVPATPAALEAICLRALSKKPADRYAKASDMALDVQHFLADEPVSAHRERLPSRVLRWGRHHQAMAASAAVLMLAAIAALTSGNILLGQKQREILAQRNAANLAEADAKKAAAEAKAVSDFLTKDLLGQASPDENARDKKVTVEELLGRAAKKIANNAKFSEQAGVEATLQFVIGATYFKLGDTKEAEPHLRRAVDLRRDELGPDDPATLVAQEELAWFLYSALHKYDEALPLSKLTWETRSRVLGSEDRDTLDSMDTYAMTVGRRGDRHESVRLHRLCLATRERVLGKDNPDTMTSANNLGAILTELGEWPEAEAIFRENYKLRRERFGLANVETMSCVNNLSYVLLLQGRFDDAEKPLLEGLEVFRGSHGAEHIKTIHVENMRSRILLAQGHLGEAEVLSRKVLDVRREKLPPGTEDIGRTLGILGEILVRQGKPSDAEPLLREASGIFRKNYPGLHELHAEVEDWLGACLMARGQYAEAEALLLPSYEILQAFPGLPARRKADALDHVVKLYEAWNKPEKAAAWRAKKVETALRK